MSINIPCFYINLNERTDRKKNVEKELINAGFTNVTRFNAIKVKNGKVGCSMSHLKCIEKAKELNYDSIVIVEDDIQFIQPNIFKMQINDFFKKHSQTNWDVLLLAGNNVPPYEIIDELCVKVSSCQTTTGYIIRKHYYDVLINNIRNGIQNLIKNPEKHFYYAIDKYWFELQRKDVWLLLIPLTITQREGYSDIEEKITNYTDKMLDLNKIYLLYN